MPNPTQINFTSIKEKIPNASFGLFRFWLRESGISDKITIKTEQKIIEDLKVTLRNAILALHRRKNLDQKPIGWDIGFVIGFLDGNLGVHWHHEYIAKSSEAYKVYAGLRAVEIFLKSDEIATLKIDDLYGHLLDSDSNIIDLQLEIIEVEFDEKKQRIYPKNKKGKALTILNNLIMKQIQLVVKMENEVRLPVQDYFSQDDIRKLIDDNKKGGL